MRAYERKGVYPIINWTILTASNSLICAKSATYWFCRCRFSLHANEYRCDQVSHFKVLSIHFLVIQLESCLGLRHPIRGELRSESVAKIHSTCRPWAKTNRRLPNDPSRYYARYMARSICVASKCGVSTRRECDRNAVPFSTEGNLPAPADFQNTHLTAGDNEKWARKRVSAMVEPAE